MSSLSGEATGTQFSDHASIMPRRRDAGISLKSSANVGENGSYENISEYILDLIRRDKERAEAEALARFKAELTHAFFREDFGL